MYKHILFYSSLEKIAANALLLSFVNSILWIRFLSLFLSSPMFKPPVVLIKKTANQMENRQDA